MAMSAQTSSPAPQTTTVSPGRCMSAGTCASGPAPVFSRANRVLPTQNALPSTTASAPRPSTAWKSVTAGGSTPLARA